MAEIDSRKKKLMAFLRGTICSQPRPC